MEAPRLGIGIISAGKVGAILGAALAAAGHRITGVHAVSEASRDRAEVLLPGVEILDPAEILRRSELVLFAVPDDVLGELVQGLAAAGHFVTGQLVAHTAGRYGTGILEPARAAGAFPLAIHPAMTFTGMSLDLQRLTDCVFAVTADEIMLPVAQALVVEMRGEPVVIAEEDRVSYHAALAHAANHLNTITAQSADMLRRIGVQDPAAILRGLMGASLDNALRSGAGALTGPVARGDVGTVRAHLAAMAKDQTETVDSYRSLSRATAQRAAALGRISPGTLQELLQVLE
ncbi:Rossmann-like and DUF2520 domain-containing protein [Glutamicibacter sp. 287]|uniref:Rossmann-like and DUF2520 domain-containing protein n=1 Tax=unclassified Glutamicibacter TaxID=2627139 RepID=UPI000BB9722E|nr:DUF2520 domain-containing protein [Glutamicibacter sp. BW80]PCC30659.1 oxidoreductase [Glutamicibacter sp. BW80]